MMALSVMMGLVVLGREISDACSGGAWVDDAREP
jgi:hypothetical protein